MLLIASCKKDVKIETPPIVPPEVVFEYKATMNGALLNAAAQYTNAAGDSLSILRLNYYISNIKFRRDDGVVFAEPESYHLNKHLDGRETFSITGLPAGTYTSIEFLIGVDSLRNVSGSQTGVLDVNEGMFWTWNTGYVFFKIEGSCNTLSDPIWDNYSIHIGGFMAPYNCLQTVKIPLSEPLIAKSGHKSTVFWHVHAEEIFMNPSVIGFDKYRGVSGGKASQIISVNYKDMFEVDKIEN